MPEFDFRDINNIDDYLFDYTNYKTSTNRDVMLRFLSSLIYMIIYNILEI
jgi:hypothetical protein